MTDTKIESKHLGHFMTVWQRNFMSIEYKNLRLVFCRSFKKILSFYPFTFIVVYKRIRPWQTEGENGFLSNICTGNTALGNARFVLPESMSVLQSTRASLAGFAPLFWMDLMWSLLKGILLIVFWRNLNSFKHILQGLACLFWRVVVLVFYWYLTNHHKHSGLKQYPFFNYITIL